MNWKRQAEEELREYRRKKESIQNIKERIKALGERMTAIGAAQTDRSPVQGGASRLEDSRIENIAERGRLAHLLYSVQREVRLIEKGLSSLSEEEREVVEGFYISGEPHPLERLCNTLHYERSRIYQIRDAAIRKYTITLYGTVEN